jgi:hypothetical protein
MKLNFQTKLKRPTVLIYTNLCLLLSLLCHTHYHLCDEKLRKQKIKETTKEQFLLKNIEHEISDRTNLCTCVLRIRWNGELKVSSISPTLVLVVLV